MTAEVTNHVPSRTRRTLNDSIARMDQMIDGLAEAIPGTIKDVLEESVSSAISEGIKAAVLEVLANPELLNVLRGSVPAPAQATNEGPIILPLPRPPLLRGLVSKAGAAATAAATAAARWCRNKAVTTAKSVASAASQVASQLAAIRQRLWTFRHVHSALVVAVAAGSVAAVVALFAPNWAVVTLSGLGGACLTAALQLAMWVRRSFGILAIDSD
jgi:hypothetical protein